MLSASTVSECNIKKLLHVIRQEKAIRGLRIWKEEAKVFSFANARCIPDETKRSNRQTATASLSKCWNQLRTSVIKTAGYEYINRWRGQLLKRCPWKFKWQLKKKKIFFYWGSAFSVPSYIITLKCNYTSEFYHGISVLFLNFLWVQLYRWNELYSFVPGFFCSPLCLWELSIMLHIAIVQSLYCCVVLHYINIPHFIFSAVDGQLGCFYLSPIKQPWTSSYHSPLFLLLFPLWQPLHLENRAD